MSDKFLKVSLVNCKICISSNLLDIEKLPSKMVMLINISTSKYECKLASANTNIIKYFKLAYGTGSKSHFPY